MDKKFEKQTTSKLSIEKQSSKPKHDCSSKVGGILAARQENVMAVATVEGSFFFFKKVTIENTIVKPIINEKDGLASSDLMPSLEDASHLGLGFKQKDSFVFQQLW